MTSRERSVAPPTYRSRPRRRVLVAEEDLQAAQGLAVLLKHLGHDVQVAHDGHAALEAARINRPHLLLLGLALPGVDGFRVLQYLRLDARFSRAPIVALARSGREEDRQRSRAAGFDDHLVKPIHLEALRSLIERF
jgi:DNA-binding response OmpR family regulator